MEDDCTACDSDWKNQRKHHIDLWMGPGRYSNQNALDACEDKITRDSTIVLVNPPSNLPVETTPLFTSDGRCTAKTFGM